MIEKGIIDENSKIIFRDGSEEAIISATRYTDGYIEFVTSGGRYSLEQLDTLDNKTWMTLVKHEITPDGNILDTFPASVEQVIIFNKVYTLGK